MGTVKSQALCSCPPFWKNEYVINKRPKLETRVLGFVDIRVLGVIYFLNGFVNRSTDISQLIFLSFVLMAPRPHDPLF